MQQHFPACRRQPCRQEVLAVQPLNCGLLLPCLSLRKRCRASRGFLEATTSSAFHRFMATIQNRRLLNDCGHGAPLSLNLESNMEQKMNGRRFIFSLQHETSKNVVQNAKS